MSWQVNTLLWNVGSNSLTKDQMLVPSTGIQIWKTNLANTILKEDHTKYLRPRWVCTNYDSKQYANANVILSECARSWGQR